MRSERSRFSRRIKYSEPWAGGPSSTAHPSRANKGLELTAGSGSEARADASGRSSGLAFGAKSEE